MSIPQSGGGPIERHEQMAEYLAEGCKPKDDWRIGTEHEKFGFCTDSLKPLPYEGERSIHAVLAGLRDRYGWAPVEEGGKLIGLTKDGAIRQPGTGRRAGTVGRPPGDHPPDLRRGERTPQGSEKHPPIISAWASSVWVRRRPGPMTRCR